jgi:hypothetical protein
MPDLIQQSTSNVPAVGAGIANLMALSSTIKKAAGGSPFRAPALKFVKGKYLTGKDTEVVAGTEFLADVSGMMTGHTKWQKRRPVDHVVGKVFDGFVPDRYALGDDDESRWERDTKGRAIDPWAPGLFMELLDVETEKPRYTFVVSMDSKGGTSAIANVIDAYARKREETPDQHLLPVIELAASGYDHPDFGWVDTPILEIVNWAPFSQPVPIGKPAVEIKPSKQAKPKPVKETVETAKPALAGSKRDDLNDAIPF